MSRPSREQQVSFTPDDLIALALNAIIAGIVGFLVANLIVPAAAADRMVVRQGLEVDPVNTAPSKTPEP